MGLIITSLRSQRSHAATAEVLTENIQLDYTAHALHLDTFALKNGTMASSLLVLVQELTQARIETVTGQPESTIDGQDWHDFQVGALGLLPYKTVLTAVDNDPHFFNLVYPLSPFPTDPTEPFGLAPNRGTQFSASWAADTANAFDTYTYDLTVEGVSKDIKGAPKGYVRFQRDAQTAGAAGAPFLTRVDGSRFLGIQNFMTTSIDDLAAAAAVDVTSIRTQSVKFSGSTRIGPFRPSRAYSTLYHQAITASPPNLLDDGSHFQDFGINNRAGDLGFAIPSGERVEVETIAGAANAFRTYPVTLI